MRAWLPYFLALVGVINLATFSMFGWDKRQARRHRPRISEQKLILWAWSTGCVGAWLGVFVFRHKSRKVSFRLLLTLTTIVNPLWVLLYFGTT